MTRRSALLVPVLAAAAGVPAAIAPGSTPAHLSYLAGFAAVVVTGWVRLRAITGPARTGYTFIVGALTVWLSGDLLHDVLTWLTGPLGDVTPSDVLWVSGYPLVAIGLIRMVRARAPGKLREAMLDALAMSTVTAWLCWQFVILPAAEDQRLSLVTVFGAFYPLGDVVLFAAGALLLLATGAKRGPTRYLTAALTLTLIGDVSISMLPALFPQLTRAIQADRLDGLLLVANSLFVAALVHPGAARMVEPDAEDEQRLHPARLVFLGISLVTLPMVAGLQIFDSRLSRGSLLVSIAVLTTLTLVRFLLVVRDQERTRAELVHQAHHDRLTGLANRQALQSGLDRALARPRGPGAPYGPVIFFLDLNGFKQINDRYGHAAGDFVLVEFARRLRAGLRPDDVAARLGGDEFVVVSEHVPNGTDARAIVERLRGLVAEPMRRGDDTLTVGVSIGMAAAYDVDRPDTDALLAAADADMYGDKTRQKVLVAGGPAG